MVRVLLERGADINQATNDGRTPLCIASQQGHVEVVRVLAERGADIKKADNDGATPLQVAQDKKLLQIVFLLKVAESSRAQAL